MRAADAVVRHLVENVNASFSPKVSWPLSWPISRRICAFLCIFDYFMASESSADIIFA
jgi:hypothetical protein